MAFASKKTLKMYIHQVLGGGCQVKMFLTIWTLVLCLIILFSTTTLKSLLPSSSPPDNANLSRFESQANAPENHNSQNYASSQPQDKSPVFGKMEDVCRKVGPDNADYCELQGDIRVEANTSTIYVLDPNEVISKSWNIKPYVRWYAPNVRNWTVKLMGRNHKDSNLIPNCTHTYNDPAIIYSMSGFIINHYHSFSDFLFPLYTVSFGFHRNVHFLATDYVWWLHEKFREIVEKLTRHQVVDIDNEKRQVYCYPKMIAGLKHSNMVIDPLSPEYAAGASMLNFKELLRDIYSLPRRTVMQSSQGQKPRLLMVSRKRSRVLTNEAEVSEAAEEIGFEVLPIDPETLTIAGFAQVINSCDLMMGIHGAGLTNMVFLPDNAVFIQILPLEIDYIGRNCFGVPAAGMSLKYLEYKITAEESSLSQQYSADDPVLKDPSSIREKGWEMFSSVYLNNQNITVDLGRFKDILLQAKNLLQD